MKNCPHCQFLVHDGADTCSVCKQPIAVPEQPAGPWGAPDAGFVPGGAATATATAARSATFVDPSPPRRPVDGLKVAIVAVGTIVLLGILGVAALVFVGAPADETVDPAAVDWAPYSDAGGAYTIDLPGAVEVIDDLGSQEGVDTAGVPVRGVFAGGPSFAVAVFRYELPPGAAFDTDQGVDGAALGMFTNPTVTRRVPAQTEHGPAIDAEVVGSLDDGSKGIGFLRLVTVGGTPYMLGTFGLASSSPELAQLHERLVASFQVPAAP
ncbi:hypothetical protein [Dermatobacter hominis]|uniref:hypothetical protein n=1 Tax=Dermatobacter hominis TaxID=2884263 RepID=UPI001D11255D|nr:hypothetical protein [Dermatobacter hominis]UDY36771.1 hypothetical protein LH044_04340 [Dermatobacter hominis]